MAKLSKPQARAHLEAEKILKKDRLSLDERIFVLENWREDAAHLTGMAGAFFTPPDMARTFAVEVPDRCDSLIDICAGIGGLSFWATLDYREVGRVVCIELNPAYAEIGRKIVPEAQWIVGDALTMDLSALGHFSVAISNPPFGRPATRAAGVRHNFEFAVIERASRLADLGVFIVPQTSAPFEYSGHQNFRSRPSESYEKFRRETGIALSPNCGIDTALWRNEWHGAAPTVEIVIADFKNPTGETDLPAAPETRAEPACQLAMAF